MAETKTKKKAKTEDIGVSVSGGTDITKEPAKKEPEINKTEKPIIAKEIDINQLIPVRNGYQGKLVYKSSRTQEKFVWPEFGDEQMMELLELRNAKNTWKKYFIYNWFMFDEEYSWVIDYLGMAQYYKNAISVDGFDEVFTMSPDEIKHVVAGLSVGQKKSLSYRARQLIAENEIDSNKAIAALEESLGIDLIEH